jgi:hypothetical protein
MRLDRELQLQLLFCEAITNSRIHTDLWTEMESTILEAA